MIGLLYSKELMLTKWMVHVSVLSDICWRKILNFNQKYAMVAITKARKI